eukprot:gnl/MRDRNA2_/MRDRNA2_192393_c0_seq1.p1 gnl/MRDRNA2_/MRDRNA2_192393_c0~~gnl/MRDRNA2_/MRDRNA2_192393_c0_seq1.p1  ORF type:complete len:187 (+),score=28.69 gnl/MRDRNA2_/MRDRNA2_192393_c0_seq1:111-671(+)
MSERASLMCANERCWYLVHTQPSYGGYCCKKCHKIDVCGPGSKKSKNHGVNCEQRVAPDGALRAPPVPPQDAIVDVTQEQQEARQNWDGRSPGSSSPARTPGVSPGVAAAWPQADSRNVTPPPPPQPVTALGKFVYTTGFIQNAHMNGLLAEVIEVTRDGRHHLRLMNDERLLFVKSEHFTLAAES